MMTTPEFRFENAILLSESPVKLAALLRLNEANGGKLFKTCTPIRSADTGCPQPFGFMSATLCLLERLQTCFDTFSGDSILVAIENYIEKAPDGQWRDCCAVAALYTSETFGELAAHVWLSPIKIQFPIAFAPEGEPDIKIPYGYSETVGSRIHKALPACASDNWSKTLDPNNPDRIEQILGALSQLKFD